MKLQDVILKAMAKKITWLEAAKIVGVCDWTMRRMRKPQRGASSGQCRLPKRHHNMEVFSERSFYFATTSPDRNTVRAKCD